MAPNTQKRAAAKFYQEDIVRRKDDPNAYGVVLDAEDMPPQGDHIDPLMRPLVQGEVGVSYFPKPIREIVSEDALELVDRLYQPGDLLKRSVDDVKSGVVTNTYVRARLEHAVNGQPIPGWKTMDEVESAVDIDMGEYVIYNDWVGQVVEMFDESLVEVPGGNLVRLPELSARLAVGEKGADILPQPMSSVSGILGFLLGGTRPSDRDTVVSVKHTVLAVAWLAINQSLTPQEAEARPRPQRYWYGADLGKLTTITRRAEEAMRVGDRVRLKDGSGPVTRHGRSSDSHGMIEVDTLVVQETRTTVDVLWQDGTRETLDAKQTVPYLNPDEYDCWPGDHVIWKTEDENRHVVVQSVNAQDRTAYVRVVETVPLERLTRLYDSAEQLEDMWGDDEGTIEEGEEVQVWEMDQDGHWVEGMLHDGDEDEWESADEDIEDTGDDEDDMDVEPIPGGGDWSPSNDTVIPPLPVDAPMSVDPTTAELLPSETAGRPKSPDVPKDATESEESDHEPDERADTPWKRFDVLPSAPVDHAFYNTPPAQHTRQFMARMSKEYKALQSSLPDSIIVRAFEDRTDLLRSLIIGPENTPYEDAPFVIDWMLDANFPQSPPIAHFLSWTNGNGRGACSNLYEEGKVCLSILGTWAGDKSESWSASRSSLLQALVSIQGLVLVKEPWFCEPAYEKLRGTEDGIVNSRLYNEKAYVLSRGFVRRALEIPLGGLEAELRWFYYTKGKLRKVLDDARALIEKSRATRAVEELPEADRERAVPRLSSGGIITLERTLAKLQALWDAYEKTRGEGAGHAGVGVEGAKS
ncbi:hypothetical protein BN946_scf184380.g1 [Trametes cinnabarina]|uniref:UBC core domain-containing protein n=1 Tax=Pycnoporus cinnabarinus TaxID=5643 RepID=A0A060SS67_PYCCI|nr:hypothetical protein BN946_scf184380.g1 [Trametes cinnabarina]